MNKELKPRSLRKQKTQKRKPPGYAFKQQVMSAWQPIPTVGNSIIIFLAVGLICVVFGGILAQYSSKIQEVKYRYDENSSKDCATLPCTLKINLDIKQDIPKPVFVYYELKNFYQNHRKYVTSRSINQLQNDQFDSSELQSECNEVVYNSQGGYEKSFTGAKLDPKKFANPCGLIAASYFNDTFTLQSQAGTDYKIENKDIAWPDDVKDKFNKGDSSLQWQDPMDERFIVWMRVSAVSHFRKIWGKINQDLKKGQYTLTINNNFPVKEFQGEKTFVLSNANVFGGKNYFLAICYFVVGVFSILVGVYFIIKRPQINEKLKALDKKSNR